MRQHCTGLSGYCGGLERDICSFSKYFLSIYHALSTSLCDLEMIKERHSPDLEVGSAVKEK